MKKIALLSICLIPSLIFAQEDDYCPCMESSNPLINVMNMMSSMGDISAENFTFQRTPTTPTNDFSPAPNPTNDFPTPTSQKKENDDAPMEETIQNKVKSVVKTKQSKFKVAKKSKRIHLKKSKKKRKYRGKCPRF